MLLVEGCFCGLISHYFLWFVKRVFLLSFLLARVGEESVLSCVDWGKVSLLGEEEGVGVEVEVEVGVGEAARR